MLSTLAVSVLLSFSPAHRDQVFVPDDSPICQAIQAELAAMGLVPLSGFRIYCSETDDMVRIQREDGSFDIMRELEIDQDRQAVHLAEALRAVLVHEHPLVQSSPPAPLPADEQRRNDYESSEEKHPKKRNASRVKSEKSDAEALATTFAAPLGPRRTNLFLPSHWIFSVTGGGYLGSDLRGVDAGVNVALTLSRTRYRWGASFARSLFGQEVTLGRVGLISLRQTKLSVNAGFVPWATPHVQLVAGAQVAALAIDSEGRIDGSSRFDGQAITWLFLPGLILEGAIRVGSKGAVRLTGEAGRATRSVTYTAPQAVREGCEFDLESRCDGKANFGPLSVRVLLQGEISWPLER